MSIPRYPSYPLPASNRSSTAGSTSLTACSLSISICPASIASMRSSGASRLPVYAPLKVSNIEYPANFTLPPSTRNSIANSALDTRNSSHTIPPWRLITPLQNCSIGRSMCPSPHIIPLPLPDQGAFTTHRSRLQTYAATSSTLVK